MGKERTFGEWICRLAGLYVIVSGLSVAFSPFSIITRKFSEVPDSYEFIVGSGLVVIGLFLFFGSRIMSKRLDPGEETVDFSKPVFLLVTGFGLTYLFAGITRAALFLTPTEAELNLMSQNQIEVYELFTKSPTPVLKLLLGVGVLILARTVARAARSTSVKQIYLSLMRFLPAVAIVPLTESLANIIVQWRAPLHPDTADAAMQQAAAGRGATDLILWLTMIALSIWGWELVKGSESPRKNLNPIISFTALAASVHAFVGPGLAGSVGIGITFLLAAIGVYPSFVSRPINALQRWIDCGSG